jgi:hypothetical protein
MRDDPACRLPALETRDTLAEIAAFFDRHLKR